MENTPTPIVVLTVLYLLARLDVPASPLRLSAALGLDRRSVLDELHRLEDKGLVDAAACRLTLVGLALIRAHRARVGQDTDEVTLAA